jgi:type I restriction enzyme S subunit
VTVWPLVELGEVFDIARGGSPRPIDAFLTDDPSGINWIMIGDAVDGSKYISSTKKRIRKEGVSRSRMVQPGDLLLTNSMSFGRPYILDTPGCIHDGWLVLSPQSEHIDSNFFYYLLGSSTIYERFTELAAGAVVKNLNISLVKSVKVALPPRPEQRRIADILERADAIRRKRTEAIALTDDLLRSAFLDMFGDPVTNPKRWPETTLGNESIEMKYGTSEKCGPVSGDALPVLRIPNVVAGEVDWSDLKFAALDERERTSLQLRTGDLLFVRSNGNPEYIARCAVYDSDRVALFASYLIRVRLKAEQLYPAYVRATLSSTSYRTRLTGEARTTAGNYNISTEGLRRLQLPVPPPALQRKFVEFELAARQARRKLAAAQEDAERLSLALVQNAFSGRSCGEC